MEEKKLTGYPSIDKPWLKYYSEKAIHSRAPECTMYEYLRQCNANELDDTALFYLGRRISYGNLFQNIESVASAFSALGIHKGDIVTIALPNIPENIYAIYALNKIGAVANLIDLRAKGKDLLQSYSEVNAQIVIVCDLFLQNTLDIVDQTSIRKIIVASPFDSSHELIRIFSRIRVPKWKKHYCELLISWNDFVKKSAGVAPAFNKGISEDPACILHTSGTTGIPKGVLLANRSFNCMVIQYRYCGLAFKPKETFFNEVPPFLAYNIVLAMHLPLCLHMSIILMPDYDPNKFVKNMIKYKPNHVIAGPANWNNFLTNADAKKHDFSFLKTMASGGDAMINKNKQSVHDLLERQGCKQKIIEGYGMTEIASAACTNLPQCNVRDSLGIPLPKTTFSICNGDCMELPYNIEGEICMTGPTLMLGYYGNEKATNEALQVHADGKVWLHSGDIGYMNKDGVVFLVGRMKRILVRHDGVKLYPYKMETLVLKDERVRECCVVGIPDKQHGHGQIPVAFVTLCAGLSTSQESVVNDIASYCKSQTEDGYRPEKYYVREQLSRTPNGKIDYRTLEQEAQKEV